MPKLIALLVVTLALQAGIYGGSQVYQQRLKKAQALEIHALQSQWASEDKQQDAARQQALDAKFGATPLDRAANNPGVDILGLLKILASQNLPKAAVLTVTVDRFTEFSIYLKTISDLSAQEKAKYLRQVLSRIDPAYVFQVAFVEEDGPTSVAEQPCLKQIRDWSRAGDAAIAKACF